MVVSWQCSDARVHTCLPSTCPSKGSPSSHPIHSEQEQGKAMDILHTQLAALQQRLSFVATDPIDWKFYVQVSSWAVALFETYLLCVMPCITMHRQSDVLHVGSASTLCILKMHLQRSWRTTLTQRCSASPRNMEWTRRSFRSLPG